MLYIQLHQKLLVFYIGYDAGEALTTGPNNTVIRYKCIFLGNKSQI